MTRKEKTISVVSIGSQRRDQQVHQNLAPDLETRSFWESPHTAAYRRSDLGVDGLAKKLDELLKKMETVLHSIPATLGEFKIESLTLDVEVSAEGEVSLLGTGAKVGGKGGLSFTLKRDPA